jgi:hypothetical protein
MAVIDIPLVRASGSGWSLSAIATIDDAAVTFDPNQDGELEANYDACALVEVRVDVTGTVRIDIYRKSNQTVWRTGTLAAGSYVYPAGGPIRKVRDLDPYVIRGA